MLRTCAATAADEFRPLRDEFDGGAGEVLGRGEVKEPSFVELRIARVGKGGKRVLGGELLEDPEHGLRPVDAVDAEDVRAGVAQFCEGVGDWCTIGEAPFRRAGERADDRAVMERLLDVEGDGDFFQIEEGLEEDELSAAIE